MITYKIVHHIPGRIKIEVPALRRLSISAILHLSERFSFISNHNGIRDIRPNPLSGHIVILYEPEKINIIKYLDEIASSEDVQKIIGG